MKTVSLKMFWHGKHNEIVQGQFVCKGHIVAVEFSVPNGLDAVAH
ncbi:hypothetical protein SAMN04488056_1177 [Cohaesibacter marisflavi]|uniref:Uncharacterized protein n=1 Tax=Cohaesibacter marisflavi TaxID=655353 RepID=A0A1I5LJB8_9HYPH|nr:hypothetical protein SAMN04488056_1177 [Cohaesibacter marisflavi]